MALKGIEASLAAVLLAVVLWSGARAQSNCTNTLTGLSPCLSFVTGSSQTPSTSCCSQLASVVQSQPQCLCMVLNGGGASLGITINQTKALELPGACNVQTPPVRECNRVAGGPNASPADSPTSGGVSKNIPGATAHASSTITSLSLSVIFSLAAIASYSTAFVGV